MVLYVPGTEERDLTKVIMSLQQVAAAVSSFNIPGRTNGSEAAAGNVGEYVQGDRLSGSPLNLTSGTPASLTSISLSAGDWDLNSFANITPAASTNMTGVALTISLVNNALDFTALRWNAIIAPTTAGTVYGNNFNLVTPVPRLLLSSAATVYLVIVANFTISTCTAYGSIRARRV